MPSLSIDKLIRNLTLLALVNLAVAVGITVPVLVPEFTFPLILTVWPGTWMFIAYFVFLIVAVLGSLGWAALFDLAKKYFGVTSVNRYMAEAQITLSMIGVYGMSSLMFAVGYTGGYAVLLGFGKATVTQGIIGWMVVPIGVFTYLFLLGTVIGIANVVITVFGRKPGPSVPVA